VFIGIAFSTFIFVGAFFRSGVVKYVANGQCINSTIERPFRMGKWLNDNGDQIQVICLQNYLFFGNASSIYTYVFALFESSNDEDESAIKCKPRFLILDLTLVTGMDTSAVDVFSQIRNLCSGNKCKLFMAGMSQNIRSILSLGGFKPDTGIRSRRQIRFFARLDAALGKAEDMLLDSDFDDNRNVIRHLMGINDTGFQTALHHIDTEVSRIIIMFRHTRVVVNFALS
jgi:SulP family sulfate permease